MERVTLRLTGLALCLALVSVAHGQAEAPKSSATLSDVNGSVLVNRGEQFVQGTEGDVLASGDRVMAMDNSGALLKYDDGCDVRVEPGTVVTLSEGSPCAGWALAIEQAAPVGMAVGAGGTAGAVGVGSSPWVYIPAATVAGVLLYEEFDDDPSSP